MEAKKLYYCEKCHRTMDDSNFYHSNLKEKYADNDGLLHLCRKCFTLHVDNWDPETIKPLLQELDLPWIPNEWNTLLARYGSSPNLTGTTVLGRYISKMKLVQYKNYRWADTEAIQEMADARVRDTMRRQGFNAGDIEKAILEGKIPMPEKPVWETEVEAVAAPVAVPAVDYGLTDEDKIYLANKWGRTYKEEEWIQMEQLYNEMMDSYDIQTAAHKDTLKMLCKTSLKANQLLDIGDVDGYQKVQKAYDSLMRSGNFTAAQNKTDNGEYVDSISEIVAICEKEGFIPRFYIEKPNDHIDLVLQDMEMYTKDLVDKETNLGNMIEEALAQIAADKEKENAVEDGIATEEDELRALFNEEGEELSYGDYTDFAEFKESLAEIDAALAKEE